MSRWGGRWGAVVPPSGRLLSASWSPGPYPALWEEGGMITTDFIIQKGEAPTFRFTATPAVDVNGWSLVMYVGRDAAARGSGSGVPLITLSPTNVDATDGVIDFALTSEQTMETLGTGRFRYDVWRTNAGFETAIAGGILQISAPARW